MAKVLQSSGVGTNLFSFGATRYFTIANTYVDGNQMSTAEADAQITYRTAGVLSALRIWVVSNTENGPIVLITRINGGDGAQSVSITAGVTGEFTDSSNTDTIAAGDEVCGEMDGTASSSGSVLISIIQTHFAATTNTVTRHATRTSGSALSGSGTTMFWALAGTFATSNIIQDRADAVMGSAGTLKNLFLNLPNNTYNGNLLVGSYVNGGAATLGFTVSAAATGIFEDTANSDAVAVGDVACFYYAPTGTTGISSIAVLSCEIETTNNKFFSGSAKPGNSTTQAINLTRYVGIAGHTSVVLSTETTAQSKLGINANGTYLHILVSSNTNDANATFNLRANATTNTALTLTITALTAGVYIDSSNSTARVSTDLLNIRLVTAGSVGTLAWRNWGLTFENTDVTTRVKDIVGLGIVPYAR